MPCETVSNQTVALLLLFAMLFDKVLSTAEMVKVYQATRPAGVGAITRERGNL